MYIERVACLSSVFAPDDKEAASHTQQESPLRRQPLPPVKLNLGGAIHPILYPSSAPAVLLKKFQTTPKQ